MPNLLAQLYQIPKKILTTKDIALIWQETNKDRLKSKISYYVKKGDLIRLRQGIFTTNKNYPAEELATSIYTPSYISLETVFGREGMTFQYYETIFVVSYLTRSIKCDGKKIGISKIKNEVLTNSAGIINMDGYSIATKERAFLDRIYLNGNYYFDNLRPLDWKKCFELAPIYQDKKLIENLNSYYKIYAKPK